VRTASRDRVADLVGNRALSARSVLASALLGADEPRLPVGSLVAIGSLFGISDGATRTCLWRMVSNGELTSDDGTYALAGPLLERRRRVDAAAHAVDDAPKWDGTWELAIVSMDRRSPADRLTLRKAATALHLAELREGVWIRPDNLDPDRLPGMRAVLDRQCVHFHHAATDVPVQLARDLFRLPDWAADARRLTEALTDEMDVDAVDATGFTYQFALSIAVVRHLQFDPLLPAELAPDDWPGPALRAAYRSFEETFKRRLYNAFR